jgi:hypothetical protein
MEISNDKRHEKKIIKEQIHVSFLEKMESENYYHPLHDNKGTLY